MTTYRKAFINGLDILKRLVYRQTGSLLLETTISMMVFDLVGSDETLALASKLVAKGGRIAVIGLAGGTLAYSALGLPWEAEVTSSAWGTRDELAEVLDLARAGRIQSRVQTYKLQQINDALGDLRAGTVDGRAVVTP